MTSRVTKQQITTHAKSRNGCKTCKEKRLKCDETKPACHNCSKRRLICPGYQQEIKWSSKSQTNKFDFPAKFKKRSRQNRERREAEALAASNEPIHRNLSAKSSTESVPRPCSPVSVVNALHRAPISEADPEAVLNDLDHLLLDHEETTTDLCITTQDVATHAVSTSDWGFLMDMELFSRPLVTSTSTSLTKSGVELPRSRFERIQSMQSLNLLADDDAATNRSLARRRPGVRDLLNGFYGVQTSVPAPIFHKATKLVEYYFSTISGLYSCFDSHLNPFRSFVGHMWTYSGSMYYAIQSMAAAHLANDLPSMKKPGLELHQQASQRLNQELSKWSCQNQSDGQILLVLLLLGLSASWHQAGDLGLPYLRTARSLLHFHPAFNNASGASAPDVLQEMFEEAMIYWEMMISFVADDSDIDVTHLSNDNLRPIVEISEATDTNVESTDLVHSSPHPWTGISPQSQMLLAQVGRLVRRVRTQDKPARRAAELQHLLTAIGLEGNLLSLELETTATSIKVESGDSLTPPDDFLTLAKATRDCALLELYRTFPDLLSRRLSTQQQSPDSFMMERHQCWLTSFAIHILQLLETIPDTSGVRCHQLLLLLMAAAELRLPSCTDDQLYDLCDFDLDFDFEFEISRARSFARARLGQMAVRLPAQPVRVMLDLLDEVWVRMDGDGDKSGGRVEVEDVFWVDVMVEKGWHTVMG